MDFGEIAERLRCPSCRQQLSLNDEQFVCKDSSCRRSFPIVDGVPVFLVDKSTQLPDDEWAKVIG
ncbi:MAG: hypothetical protein CMJ78_07890 [Planctomycetaceae bacterium]|nr:hypothetical protein [Planctomycetaceae bacterium]